jgi:hypothetical protein
VRFGSFLDSELTPVLMQKEKEVVKTSGKILAPQTHQRIGRRIEIQGELNDAQSGDHFWVAVKIAGLC